MKTINVEIEGVTPILMHSAESMGKAKTVKKNPAKQYDAVKDAEEVAYRNKNKELYLPSRCLKACFINGAAWRKFGNKGAKPIIAGCTRIEPYEIVFYNGKGKVLKDYEIDLRPVVIQRARIMRARPRIDEWKLKFNIIYEDKIIADADILKEILEESGQRVGLLDNRPQKYGENGTFKVTKFKVL